MRFATLSGLLLIVVVNSGCNSTVGKSGDATIKRLSQFPYHTPGRESFYIVLPLVSLAQTGTNVLRVRELPLYLAGLFHYSLSMPLKYEEDASEQSPPWKDARITVIFRQLDGAELCRQELTLGANPMKGYGIITQHRWDLGWQLDTNCVNPQERSFDIVVVVEKPSARPSDRLLFTAYAGHVPKP